MISNPVTEAKKHCNDDETIRAEILNAQAENLLQRAIKQPSAAGFREAARIFAKSDALLSEIALKLLPTAEAGLDENRFRNEAVIFFLKTRLPSCGIQYCKLLTSKLFSINPQLLIFILFSPV